MDEEKENKGEQEAGTNIETGNKPKEDNVLDRADAINERMEKVNKEREGLIQREEELFARKRVGGETEVGQAPEKKEETPEEYAKKILGNG